MSLPPNWPTAHVTCRGYVELDGTPCKGQIIFVVPRELSIDDVVVLPRKLMLDLDANGIVDGYIPASDYPDTDTPFAYTVIEQLIGHPPNTYPLIVPGGAEIDLATAVPAITDPAAPTYRLVIGTVQTGTQAAASLEPVSRTAQKLNLTLPAGALPSGGNEDDVMTKTASGAAWQAPSIPWASTNW